MSEQPGRVAFENTLDQIILQNKSAEKSDQGRYQVTMKNEMGQDTASVNVIVVGKLMLYTFKKNVIWGVAIINVEKKKKILRFLLQ